MPSNNKDYLSGRCDFCGEWRRRLVSVQELNLCADDARFTRARKDGAETLAFFRMMIDERRTYSESIGLRATGAIEQPETECAE